MNKLLQFAIAIVLVSLTLYVFNAVASFFNIGIQYYGVYMFFGVAMIFLYFILPNKTTNIFQ